MRESVSTARRQLIGKPYAEIAAETALCSVGTRKHVYSTFPESSVESGRLSGAKIHAGGSWRRCTFPYIQPRVHYRRNAGKERLTLAIKNSATASVVSARELTLTVT